MLLNDLTFKQFGTELIQNRIVDTIGQGLGASDKLIRVPGRCLILVFSR